MRAKKRLAIIASKIEKEKCVADIGADHGYLTKILLEQKRAEKVIATDISEKSLQKSIDLSKRFGFENQIETRVGNGFEPLRENEVDVAVVAGMGGQEIIKMLKTQNLKNIKKFIFQPAQNAPELRKYLCENGYEIVSDEIVQDQKKFYFTIMTTKNGKNEKLQNWQILFGKYAQNCKNGDFFDFLEEYISKKQKLIDDKIENKKIQEELKLALDLKKYKQEGDIKCKE